MGWKKQQHTPSTRSNLYVLVNFLNDADHFWIKNMNDKKGLCQCAKLHDFGEVVILVVVVVMGGYQSQPRLALALDLDWIGLEFDKN